MTRFLKYGNKVGGVANFKAAPGPASANSWLSKLKKKNRNEKNYWATFQNNENPSSNQSILMEKCHNTVQ